MGNFEVAVAVVETDIARASHTETPSRREDRSRLSAALRLCVRRCCGASPPR